MGKHHVRKDDEVAVLSGKWKGEHGKVLAVIPGKDRVVLELAGLSPEKQRQVGRRTLPRAKRKNQAPGGAGLIERGVSLHISNVGKKRATDAAANAPAAATGARKSTTP